MVRANEIRKNNGQLEFSLAVLGTGSLEAKAPGLMKRPGVASNAATRQLTLSAERVLVGLAVSLGFIGAFLWVLVRLWLFEP